MVLTVPVWSLLPALQPVFCVSAACKMFPEQKTHKLQLPEDLITQITQSVCERDSVSQQKLHKVFQQQEGAPGEFQASPGHSRRKSKPCERLGLELP